MNTMLTEYNQLLNRFSSASVMVDRAERSVRENPIKKNKDILVEYRSQQETLRAELNAFLTQFNLGE